MKNRFLNIKLMVSFLAAALFITACSDDEDTGQYYQKNLRDLTVREYIENGSNNEAGNAKYTTLYAALAKANLLGTLEGEVTLLAPSNAAFEAAGIVLDDLSADQLANILSYHVVSGQAESDALVGGVTTVQGSTITINDGCINGKASFGAQDINVNNGVIHEIDGVLEPPTGDIVEKVAEFASSATPEFTLLQAALVKSGLDATLSGNTVYTLFAPTDAAFTAVGLDQTGIDAATPQELEDILLFHVLAGTNFSCAIEAGRVATAAGELETTKGVDISVGDGIAVEDAVITTSDILATNGVIHEVDEVIFPKSTIFEALNQSNIGFVQYYRTHRFYEVLEKSGITYDLNDNVILYVPSTNAMDAYLDNLGTTVAGLTVAECETLVNLHTFTVKSSDLVAETYFTNESEGATFLYNSNSDGNFLNIMYNAFGFSTLDESFIADTDRSGLGFGFLAFDSWQDEVLYNGVITTTTSVLSDLPTNTIMDELIADGNYTALVAAANKTGLNLGTTNYTLFAPTDAAFADIGYDAATIAALDPVNDEDEIEDLEEILLNHLSARLLPGTSILDAGEITTVGGLVIGLEVDGGNVVVTNNTVVGTDNPIVADVDILVNNGIVHGGLSAVLKPL